jgi:hypothetical protein
MTVYHGSTAVIQSPELHRSIRTLDFGPGFYTTTNRERPWVLQKKSTSGKSGGRKNRRGNLFGVESQTTSFRIIERGKKL